MTAEMIAAGHEELARQGIALDSDSGSIYVDLLYQAMASKDPHKAALESDHAAMLEAMRDIEMETRRGGQWTTADINELAQAVLAGLKVRA